MLLLPLLLKATLLRLASGSYRPFYNGFYYNHIMNDNDDGQDKGMSGTGRLSQEAEVPPCLWVGWRPTLGGMWGPEEQAGMLQRCLGDAHGRRGGGWREDLRMLPSPGS